MWIKILYGYQTTVIQVPTWWTARLIDDYCKANFKQFMNWYGGKDKEDAERYEFDMTKFGYKKDDTFVKLGGAGNLLNQFENAVKQLPKVEENNPVKYCETFYPEMCAEFKKQQQLQYELLCKKQMDYGPLNISMGTQLKTQSEILASLTGIVVRANDKMQRLLNLIVVNRQDPKNESIDDTFDDLAVYSTIAKCVKNGKWGR